MADFSYQALVGAPAPKPPPQSLWSGLSQQPPSGDPSLLAQMRAKQAQQQDPRVFMREINPEPTWGGRDSNAIQPNDLMQSHFSPLPPEII